jgi:hypothetical protein
MEWLQTFEAHESIGLTMYIEGGMTGIRYAIDPLLA